MYCFPLYCRSRPTGPGRRGLVELWLWVLFGQPGLLQRQLSRSRSRRRAIVSIRYCFQSGVTTVLCRTPPRNPRPLPSTNREDRLSPLTPPAPTTHICCCYYPVATRAKIALGTTTLLFMLLVDLTSFPSLTGWERGSLLAVQNWPGFQREAFAWVSCKYFSGLPRGVFGVLLLLVVASDHMLQQHVSFVSLEEARKWCWRRIVVVVLVVQSEERPSFPVQSY